MAVHVTDVPVQIEFEGGDMETLAVSTGLTIIVKLLETAGLPDLQLRFDVSTQVTISLFTGV